MDVREKIKNVLSQTVGIAFNEVYLETPERQEYGDYATNVALSTFGNDQLSIFNSQYKNPRQYAEAIKSKLLDEASLKDIVDKIEVAGGGFINFWLNKEVLSNNIKAILESGGKYGQSSIKKGKRVIVEYSSPGIAKPFTIGHLRSTIIGDSIANLLEAVGFEVYRDNHLGDWGTQFGKQIYAIKTWGDEKEIEASPKPLKILVDLYVKFHQEAEKDPSIEDEAREWFRKLENGDQEARRLWKKCVDWSWLEFEQIYNILDVKFSKEFENGRGLGEAFFEDKMQPVINELQEKKLLTVGEGGAKLVFFKDDKLPPAMIVKKDGTTLYHTRDLATDRYRLDKFGTDILIINEVGVEQTLYFRQLFKMEKLLGWVSEKQRVHVAHGLIRFKDKKMSTRKGDVIWLEDVFDEGIKRAKKLGSTSQNLAETVAVGAIKYNDLKRDLKNDYIFEWNEVLNMQGNSGPYLQYTYARTQSVLSKAEGVDFDSLDLKTSVISNKEYPLLRSLICFPQVIQEAAEKYTPNLVCNYLFDLAQKFNSFYNSNKILVEDNDVRNLRLELTFAVGQVIKNGLGLLGMKSPQRM